MNGGEPGCSDGTVASCVWRGQGRYCVAEGGSTVRNWCYCCGDKQ